ncbi:MAG: DUF3822 family protein [Flavobacteriales bacterium]|nr:DUF3822 family protein [Flavobacteriales bacterium]MCB9203883.1 DUF3822 family protein [Flavobacteriales bacterium]
MIKKELHLKPDNEQEAADGRLSCFVDISRNGIQLLKLNDAFKTTEFVSWSFPNSETDAVWTENVNEVLTDEAFRSAVAEIPYKFSVSDCHLTIVPETLFEDEVAKSQIEFLFGESGESKVITQKLSNTDAVCVIRIPNALAQKIAEPINSSFITWVDGLLGNSSGIKVNVTLNEKRFSLTIQKDGKLLFSNWFNHSKPDDVLYFLMASLESMNILHSDAELILSGRVDKGDEVYSILSRFISKISFAKRPKNLTYSYSFNQIPEHRFPFILAAACA